MANEPEQLELFSQPDYHYCQECGAWLIGPHCWLCSTQPKVKTDKHRKKRKKAEK